ncbi:hypothetical protein LOTGIDRAFT_169971 [Lottia gigantea]|uniref:EF-hand domain-containing protein n=1 Tax=Lottia gigantea TaxID=225164 RepID=V3ZEJ2_LOTGI|nr:hypothetical protein LOTGIDRAFT_169971 [Lottia gigantea]ESO82497.1 hypothetical protein LOTGIDRAFT_169971 [Lottia gigantea]
MVHRMTVKFLVCICAVQLVYSDIITNIKTEAGVETLLQERFHFYLLDFDDNNLITLDNCLRGFLIDDINNDGKVTYDEVISNPDTPNAPLYIFQAWDADGDGSLSLRDIIMSFQLLPGTGNEMDLLEYLTLEVSRLNATTGPTMKIQSFIHAERDFFIIDENDDNVLTRMEFQVEFRQADKDKNGNLDESEVRNMFPMRSTPPKRICPSTTSCSVNDVLPLFDSADKNGDSELTIKEYIQHFGHLIEI